jgi:hypothetical protein
MAVHLKLTGRLRTALLAVLTGEPTRDEINHLVAVCHSLAISFIAGKHSIGGLRLLNGLSTSDIAFDSIAELFRQDDKGNCVQLQAYFAGLRLMDAKEEEILSHLRRLVFSKVNQGIFRLYSEADPSLARILRNLKLAVGTLKNFTELERFGEVCLTPALCDTLEHLPPFDREELDKRFGECTNGREMIPEMTAKLSLLLRGQNEYCRIIPMVTIGMLIRSVYEKKEIPLPRDTGATDHLEVTDAAAAIRRACEDLKKANRAKYVGREKVAEETFDHYFHAIEEELNVRCGGTDGSEASLYERLIKMMPGLTKEEYHHKHRNRVEYLLKLASGRVRVLMRG